MSDVGERLDLRDLPPVEPVEPPSRLSMTLLRHYQACNRAGYLYLKRKGGIPAHNLDFGTAGHLFAERAMRDLIQQGERTLYAVAEGESITHAQQQVASMTAAMVDEVLREHPELTVPVAAVVNAGGDVVRATQDDLREAAYHWAVGYDVDPGRVIGLERKFTLDLECGWTVVGKVDVLAEDGPERLLIDDYKFGFAMPTEQEFSDRFQHKVYGTVVLFGTPDDGSSLGRGVQEIRARELYPRHKLRDDGSLQRRETVFTRQQLADFRWDLERLGYELSEALETGKFPAVPGSHCSVCPSPMECPLPAHLRDAAGSVESEEQAVTLLAWADRMGRDVSAAKREVRRFVDERGLKLRLGDRLWEIVPTTSVKVDKHGLAEAAVSAAQYGTPLRVEDFEDVQTSMRFAGRKLSAAEIEGLSTTTGGSDGDDGSAEMDRDSRYGAKAPF